MSLAGRRAGPSRLLRQTATLSRVVGTSPRQRVRSMLASVATSMVLAEYTLRGTSGKRSFEATPTYRAIVGEWDGGGGPVDGAL